MPSSEKVMKYCDYHKRNCLWTKKGSVCIEQKQELKNEYYKQKEVPSTQCCKICKQVLNSTEFHKQRSNAGIKTVCKKCIRQRDYAIYNSWPGYIRKKVVTSWKAHGNVDKINSISIEDATTLLEKQNYMCKHCNHQLECTFGTIKKRNCWGASLDRINTDIIGYGTGNAQWLCTSCNNGKSTMDTKEHENKFSKRDEKIKELEQEVARLKDLLLQFGYKDAVQRLDGDGSEYTNIIFID